MAYFPFFFEVNRLKGVVIGGGRIALEKIEKLDAYEAELTVIAPEILPKICEYKCVKNIVRREFEEGDLEEADYVIAATDIIELNERVRQLCRSRHLPVNVVDNQALCDFIFPSVYKRGPLVVGVSSSGASPQVAIELRKQFEENTPDNIEEILDYLASIRPYVKEKVTNPKIRHHLFGDIARESMRLGRALEQAELEQLITSAASTRI